MCPGSRIRILEEYLSARPKSSADGLDRHGMSTRSMRGTLEHYSRKFQSTQTEQAWAKLRLQQTFLLVQGFPVNPLVFGELKKTLAEVNVVGRCNHDRELEGGKLTVQREGVNTFCTTELIMLIFVPGRETKFGADEINASDFGFWLASWMRVFLSTSILAMRTFQPFTSSTAKLPSNSFARWSAGLVAAYFVDNFRRIQCPTRLPRTEHCPQGFL